MASRTKANLQEAQATWNYTDVIALVTAYLPANDFNGDRGAWLRGISELAEQYPGFFGQVHFIQRHPLPPYSQKVDEVLKMLGKWEYQGSFNPRFRKVELGEDAKTELRHLLEPRFTADEIQKVREMSDILARHVAWKPQGLQDATGSRKPTSGD